MLKVLTSLSRETIRVASRRTAFRLTGPSLDLQDSKPDTVWHRRPCAVPPAGSLHPADLDFVKAECRVFRHSLFGILFREAFWVNPPECAARADRKLLQQSAAVEVGFDIPQTLYSNDPREIREFIREHGGTVVYKPFTGGPWRDAETYWMTFTSAVTIDDLVDDDLLQATPGIYQEIIPKLYELRITVMGSCALTAKILSQETRQGRLDWRKSYADLKMEIYELPELLCDLCGRLLRKLGLVFGCFDVAVTPDGRFVFFEVNESGQFLFLERYTDLPLLDAFSAFLLAGSPDFRWERPRTIVRYADVKDSAVSRMKEDLSLHVEVPEDYFWEGALAGRRKKRRG